MSKTSWFTISFMSHFFIMSAIAGSVQVIDSMYGSSLGPVSYRLILPHESLSRKNPQALFFAFHGCKETAEQFDRMGRFQKLALDENVVILIPEQSLWRNIDHCWNWFLPENQKRDSGELKILRELLENVRKQHHLQQIPVIVAGLSSGAALANLFSFCYADLVSMVAIHSGLEFAAAGDPWEAQRILLTKSAKNPERSGAEAAACPAKSSPHLRVPSFIIHGTLDRRLSPQHSEQTLIQILTTHDVWDDGTVNHSIPSSPPHVTVNQVPDGYRFEIKNFEDARGVLIRDVKVEGMAHAWSGGPSDLPNSDPKGPDATLMIWNFFKELRP